MKRNSGFRSEFKFTEFDFSRVFQLLAVDRIGSTERRVCVCVIVQRLAGLFDWSGYGVKCAAARGDCHTTRTTECVDISTCVDASRVVVGIAESAELCGIGVSATPSSVCVECVWATGAVGVRASRARSGAHRVCCIAAKRNPVKIIETHSEGLRSRLPERCDE